MIKIYPYYGDKEANHNKRTTEISNYRIFFTHYTSLYVQVYVHLGAGSPN